MSSLKAFIPGLARHLDISPAALYERQRALVRAGLLDLGEGRGPGSGVRTTWGSVAYLLLSVLATDRLSELDTRVPAIAKAKPKNGNTCPFTGTKTFIQALTKLMVQTGSAQRVSELTVSRTADRAFIKYYDMGDWTTEKVSEFVGRKTSVPAISVAATISNSSIVEIAKDVQAIVLESFEDQESPDAAG